MVSDKHLVSAALKPSLSLSQSVRGTDRQQLRETREKVMGKSTDS